MADIRINQLPAATGGSAPVAIDNLAIDGPSTRKATIQQVVDTGAPIATQSDAIAGTNATKRMTPLTTKQSIASEVGVTLASAAQGDLADSALQPGDAATPAQGAKADAALPRNEYAFFDTEALFQAANIPASVNEVRTNGYYTAGDFGGAMYIRMSAAPSPVQAWHKQSADGAWWALSEPSVTLVMFGGRRTYAFNNRQAFLDAAAYCASTGAVIYDLGNYGISGAVDISSVPVTIMGRAAAPHLWYATVDDKKYMRPGNDTDGVAWRDKMPGFNLWYKNGGPVAEHPLPNRTDFTFVKPCMTVSANFNTLKSVGIIQDITCFNADGSFTPLGSENIATDFDTILFVKDGSQNTFEDVTRYGRPSKFGTLVWSTPGNDDPDYNMFVGGSSAGFIGAALLGSNQVGGQAAGLSGTVFCREKIMAGDHNSRVATDTIIAHYADLAGSSAIFLDGDVEPASGAEINGHYFTDCVVRTAVETPLVLSHVSNLVFKGTVFECNGYGVTNSPSIGRFVANANTKKSVMFLGCRINHPTLIFNSSFIGAMSAGVKVGGFGDPLGSMPWVAVSNPEASGGYVLARFGTDRGVGDIGFQLTRDVTSENSGWNVGMDVSALDTLDFRYGGVSQYSLTTGGIRVPVAGERRIIKELGVNLVIASDTITVTRSFHTITTEGGAATDTLSTINGGVEGMELTLCCGGAGQTITVSRSAGNIRLDGSTDKTLGTTGTYIKLFYRGGFWRQITPVMVTG